MKVLKGGAHHIKSFKKLNKTVTSEILNYFLGPFLQAKEVSRFDIF